MKNYIWFHDVNKSHSIFTRKVPKVWTKFEIKSTSSTSSAVLGTFSFLCLLGDLSSSWSDPEILGRFRDSLCGRWRFGGRKRMVEERAMRSEEPLMKSILNA